MGLLVGFGLSVGWMVVLGDIVGFGVGWDVGSTEIDGDCEGSADG